MNGLDSQLLLTLRSTHDLSDPVGPEWVERMAIDFTSLGGHTVLTTLVLVTALFLLQERRRNSAVVLVASAGGAMLLSHALKLLFARDRPDLVEHLVGVVTHSFPSGHALLSSAIYLTLAGVLGRGRSVASRRYLLGVAIALTVLIGISRLYLGVHWPSDVLAGWMIGSAWAWATLRFTQDGLTVRTGQSRCKD